MRSRITAVFAGSVLAAAGLGLGLSLPAAAHTTQASAAATLTSAAAHRHTVAINCANKPVTRPRHFILTCADANDTLTAMTWTSWRPKLASGYGTERINTCRPNCAEGKFRNYPVLVVFWGHATVRGHHGQQRYRRYTLLYPGARPPVYKLSHGKVVTTHPLTRTDPLWP